MTLICIYIYILDDIHYDYDICLNYTLYMIRIHIIYYILNIIIYDYDTYYLLYIKYYYL